MNAYGKAQAKSYDNLAKAAEQAINGYKTS